MSSRSEEMPKHHSLNYWKKLVKMAYLLYVSYEKFGRNRQVEEDYIHEELNVIKEYKTGFDEALALIYDGKKNQKVRIVFKK